MNMRVLFFLLLIAGFDNFLIAQEKVIIESKTSNINTEFAVDDFYFIHHIFADAFFMTTLGNDVDTIDIEKVVKEVNYKLSDSYSVAVTIERSDKPDAWIDFSIINNKAQEKLLIMKTNFIQKTKAFTSDLKDKNLFVRTYYLSGNKLVYRKDLYTKEEEEVRKKESQHALAEYYLFNDRIDDDTLVLGLLDPIITSDTASNLDKLYAKLYYTEYYLSIGNFTDADEKLRDLVTFYNQNMESIPSAYELIIKLAGIEVYLNNQIRNKR